MAVETLSQRRLANALTALKRLQDSGLRVALRGHQQCAFAASFRRSGAGCLAYHADHSEDSAL